MTQAKINDKKKKLILFLGIPFMILLFGGLYYLTMAKGKNAESNTATETPNMFNHKLPNASLPETEKNKLELYMQAKKDSLRKIELEQNDPYAKNFLQPEAIVPGLPASPYNQPSPATTADRNVDANTKKVNERLQQIDAILNQVNSYQPSTGTSAGTSVDYSGNEQSIAKLEQLVATAGTKETQDDRELAQINATLDKFLDVQDPERVKARRAGSKNKTSGVYHNVYGSATAAAARDTFLQYTLPNAEGVTNRFYTLQRATDTISRPDIAIRAVVHQTQTLQDGSTIKLRLIQPIFINGIEIPKDQFIFGKCSISDERLLIVLDKVIFNNEIFPVKLSVFDGVDGQLGLNVPGAITRDASKENAERAIQSVGLGSLDPTLSAQAASVGIETAKTMLSRKVRIVKVIAKAGDILLLKNEDNFN